MGRYVIAVVLAVILAMPGLALESGTPRVYRTDSAVVRYSGVGEDYAKAVALTAQAARDAAAGYGFDMPASVTVEVGLGDVLRLFTDGDSSLHLTVRSEADLHKPSESGVFILYGICHEVGHIAMYRAVRERMWMTSGAAEGWAHFLGSRLVDEVYEREGGDLWPDVYDYLQDGTTRLDRQMKAQDKSQVTVGAGLWQALSGIIGEKGIAELFTAWGAAQVDPADPGAALRRALLETHDDGRLSDWWNAAEPLFVTARSRSEFAARTVLPGVLRGEPTELAIDDGDAVNKRSIAGGGHAVLFEVPGDSFYLTGVRIYGERYGYPAPPREDFHVWLCDEDFKEIADFKFPYSTFAKGNPQDVKLWIEPTKVPVKFVIIFGFNPTSSKGVFVHHDKEGSGKSFVALPGRPGSVLENGDWLIRAVIDQEKGVDALSGME